MGAPVALEQGHPFRVEFFAATAEFLSEMIVDTVRHQKFLILGPAIGPFGQPDLFLAQRLAVRARGVLLVRRAVTDVAFDDDQARPIVNALGDRDCISDPLAIVGVADPLHVPAIGEEPPGDILGEGKSGIALDRDVVAIVDPAKIAELQMAGKRGGLAADPLHHAAVAAQREDVVIEQGETRLVEIPRQPVCGNRHADARCNPLAKRSRCGLDTRGQVVFRMTWAFAVELAKALQIVERHRRSADPLVIFVDRLDAGQVQHRIEQGRGMAGGKHEAIAVRPDRILRIETEEILPQRVDDRRHRHRRARMAGFRLLNGVNAKGANGVDADFVDRTSWGYHARPFTVRTGQKRTPTVSTTNRCAVALLVPVRRTQRLS